MSRRRPPVVLVLGAAVVVGLTTLPAAAQASARVGPDQTFRGLVNGRSGARAPVTIRMACAGPVRPGQAGHPVAGQTVEVLLGALSASGAGFTAANATSIGAFFGAPPPAGPARATGAAAEAAAAAGGQVSLARYGVVRSIPTSLVLPCTGTGQVTFVPLPMTAPTSRDAIVPVRYVAPDA